MTAHPKYLNLINKYHKILWVFISKIQVTVYSPLFNKLKHYYKKQNINNYVLNNEV